MQLNQRTMQFGYFGVPAVVFVGIRLLIGGPQSTQAAGPVEMGPSSTLPSGIVEPVSLDGRAPLEIAEGMRTQLSPFWYDQVVEMPMPEIDVPIEYDPTDVGMPTIEVSSILPHPNRPLAVINGKPCKLGDRIGGDWTLSEIDGDTRTITIRNTMGELQVIPISRE